MPNTVITLINTGPTRDDACARQRQLIDKSLNELRDLGAHDAELACRDGLRIRIDIAGGEANITVTDHSNGNVEKFLRDRHGTIEITRSTKDDTAPADMARILGNTKQDLEDFLAMRRMLLRYKDAYVDQRGTGVVWPNK